MTISQLNRATLWTFAQGSLSAYRRDLRPDHYSQEQPWGLEVPLPFKSTGQVPIVLATALFVLKYPLTLVLVFDSAAPRIFTPSTIPRPATLSEGLHSHNRYGASVILAHWTSDEPAISQECDLSAYRGHSTRKFKLQPCAQQRLWRRYAGHPASAHEEPAALAAQNISPAVTDLLHRAAEDASAGGQRMRRSRLPAHQATVGKAAKAANKMGKKARWFDVQIVPGHCTYAIASDRPFAKRRAPTERPINPTISLTFRFAMDRTNGNQVAQDGHTDNHTSLKRKVPPTLDPNLKKFLPSKMKYQRFDAINDHDEDPLLRAKLTSRDESDQAEDEYAVIAQICVDEDDLSQALSRQSTISDLNTTEQLVVDNLYAPSQSSLSRPAGFSKRSQGLIRSDTRLSIVSSSSQHDGTLHVDNQPAQATQNWQQSMMHQLNSIVAAHRSSTDLQPTREMLLPEQDTEVDFSLLQALKPPPKHLDLQQYEHFPQPSSVTKGKGGSGGVDRSTLKGKDRYTPSDHPRPPIDDKADSRIGVHKYDTSTAISRSSVSPRHAPDHFATDTSTRPSRIPRPVKTVHAPQMVARAYQLGQPSTRRYDDSEMTNAITNDGGGSQLPSDQLHLEERVPLYSAQEYTGKSGLLSGQPHAYANQSPPRQLIAAPLATQSIANGTERQSHQPAPSHAALKQPANTKRTSQATQLHATNTVPSSELQADADHIAQMLVHAPINHVQATSDQLNGTVIRPPDGRGPFQPSVGDKNHHGLGNPTITATDQTHANAAFAALILDGVSKATSQLQTSNADLHTDIVRALAQVVQATEAILKTGKGLPQENAKRKSGGKKTSVPKGFAQLHEEDIDESDEEDENDPDVFKAHPSWIPLKRAVRMVFRRLLGVNNYKPEQLQRLPLPLSSAEIENFGTSNSLVDCTITFYRVDLSQPWKTFCLNSIARKVFIDHFMACWTDRVIKNRNIPFDFVTNEKVAWALDTHVSHVKTVYRKFRNGELPEASESSAKRAAQATRRSTVRSEIKQHMSETLKAFTGNSCYVLDVRVRRNVMSDDETDPETPSGSKTPKNFRIIRLAWRSEEFTIFLRTLDDLYLDDWRNPIDRRATPGNPPRTRLESDGFTLKNVPKGLYRNCYDADYLAGLHEWERAMLNIIEEDYDFEIAIERSAEYIKQGCHLWFKEKDILGAAMSAWPEMY
ncbi:hypothetical protein CONPUDRAFT_73479 [Coniophora puteana RWD-64-598 SS2]|uniref:Uncharacterized protein n=1 Tax=Coniophora puteana (strain RWD-64-598) TaxID=741705 RepID=A0A5M3MNW8_CONPW|nr:uncharacterized protein CONPUDRAFT_73479 [Coniophora puteana RWD-64-598 SS2]EIW80331.1 hypothetical protein CONPUDRAFT_73479 [Coniophora puteana RWD-64-598 SS2]